MRWCSSLVVTDCVTLLFCIWQSSCLAVHASTKDLLNCWCVYHVSANSTTVTNMTNGQNGQIDLLFSTWASEYNVHLTCLLLIWQACLKIDTKLPSQCQEQTVVKTKKTWLGKRLSVWENLWSLLKEYAHDEARFKTIGHNSIQSLYSRREGGYYTR